jgi:hypothetical protein
MSLLFRKYHKYKPIHRYPHPSNLSQKSQKTPVAGSAANRKMKSITK